MLTDSGLAAKAGFERVALPHAFQREVTARDGSVYRLLVSLPPEPPPPQGFPVMVLPDGHALFATAAMAARLQAARPQVTGVGPAMLVGIGYPGDAPFDSERRQADFLPVTGGADRFLDTILAELLPVVERLAPLDASRRSLVGHSYGGLFCLHALFTRPGAFEAHVAGSPSIWWGHRAILQTEEIFRAGGSDPAGRLLVTVGGAEQPAEEDADPQRAARQRQARMIDNASEMAARLSDCSRLTTSFVAFPGENHVSVIPAMLARAVAFALAGTASSTAETA